MNLGSCKWYELTCTNQIMSENVQIYAILFLIIA